MTQTNTRAKRDSYLRKIRTDRERARGCTNAEQLFTFAEMSTVAAFNARNPKMSRDYMRSANAFRREAMQELAKTGVMFIS